MKDGLHAQNKMNSLARSNASLSGYGGTVPPGQVPNGAKDDLYDRLRRHAYQGKKSGLCTDHFLTLQYLIIIMCNLIMFNGTFLFIFLDKSGNETTSDSDGQ